MGAGGVQGSGGGDFKAQLEQAIAKKNAGKAGNAMPNVGDKNVEQKETTSTGKTEEREKTLSGSTSAETKPVSKRKGAKAMAQSAADFIKSIFSRKKKQPSISGLSNVKHAASLSKEGQITGGMGDGKVSPSIKEMAPMSAVVKGVSSASVKGAAEKLVDRDTSVQKQKAHEQKESTVDTRERKAQLEKLRNHIGEYGRPDFKHSSVNRGKVEQYVDLDSLEKSIKANDSSSVKTTLDLLKQKKVPISKDQLGDLAEACNTDKMKELLLNFCKGLPQSDTGFFAHK